jgi:hypothetical protein
VEPGSGDHQLPVGACPGAYIARLLHPFDGRIRQL